MITLDEAIAHAREVASEQRRRSGTCTTNDNECDKFSNCMKCAEEHEQLAEWLEELKKYRENSNGYRKEDIELNRNAMYNKAIDDAIDKISCGGKYNMSLVDELRKLKDGGENDD